MDISRAPLALWLPEVSADLWKLGREKSLSQSTKQLQPVWGSDEKEMFP